MAVNEANIFAQPCHVYFKSRGATPAVETDDAAATGWIDAGVMNANTAKCEMKPKTIKVHYGEAQIGGDAQFDCESLEVAAANITALEALKDKVIDIIAKPTSPTETRVYKFLAFKIKLGFFDDLGGENASKIPITAVRGSVKNIGDYRKQITLSWSL